MNEDVPTPPAPNPADDVNPFVVRQEIVVDASISKRKRPNFWRRLGGEGLTISIGIHLALVMIAAYFVISTVTTNAKKESNAFATGAGGGSGGEKAKTFQHKIQPKNVKTLSKSTTRITSKSASSSIVLPDMPASASAASMVSGMMAGGSSKGFGGGSGGGIGSGKGMGVGGGKNFVSKPVMGANIFAQKIAVYFDSSDSLIDYLDKVQEEIKKSFPDADVSVYEQPAITIQDGDVVGGHEFMRDKKNVVARKVNTNPKRPGGGDKPVTEPKRLSAVGKNIFSRYDTNFQAGKLGAWLDILRKEKAYDALVVFTDFDDYGLTQLRIKGVKVEKGMKPSPLVVFSDDANYGVGRGIDNRKPMEKEWEKEWITTFTGAKTGATPKLYIFSTKKKPGDFLTECVKASGGEVVMLTGIATGTPTAVPAKAAVVPGMTVKPVR